MNFALRTSSNARRFTCKLSQSIWVVSFSYYTKRSLKVTARYPHISFQGASQVCCNSPEPHAKVSGRGLRHRRQGIKRGSKPFGNLVASFKEK
jgi:hypothetical protein